MFYESIGLTLKKRWGNFYAQMVTVGVEIGLHPNEKSNSIKGSGNLSIGFTIDNFEEAKSFLQNVGIEEIDRSEVGGQFLHFSDPDGTALYFIKPKG